MSDVTTGHGTQLWLNLGAGLKRIPEIDDIPELPSGERGLYETTSHDSVDFKEFKKEPLKEGVEITITGNYVIGSEAESDLQDADDEEGAISYRIVVKQGADTYYVEGNALFYNFKRGNAKDGKRTFTIVLKPVAAPTTDEAA